MTGNLLHEGRWNPRNEWKGFLDSSVIKPPKKMGRPRLSIVSTYPSNWRALSASSGALEVEVRSLRRAACHHCGSASVAGHGSDLQRIRDRACAHPTVLLWSQRRP